MNAIRSWLRGAYHTGKLIVGFLVYVAFKKTPYFAHQSMIFLFCRTRGYSNDLLSQIIGLFSPPYAFDAANGVLGNMLETGRRQPVVAALRETGYHVFENRLPEEVCTRLLQYATSHPCTLRHMDGEQARTIKVPSYHRGSPRAVRYDFDIQDLLANLDIQRLLADLSFAAVAQDYFGSRPIVDSISIWWHTSFSDIPDSEAAQYYHFDMDRPKWLKFFIYLTDVKATNGPHSFVAGSHKSGRIPSSLLSKGYSRLTDEEVTREFTDRDIIEFAAPRGTIIAEDTRGLHKGKHVQEGDRLILQIQYSNSLFGGFYPKVQMTGDLSSDIRDNIGRFPGLYANYL
jgi:phytanoyl-CoA dioxygenase PhyH